MIAVLSNIFAGISAAVASKEAVEKGFEIIHEINISFRPNLSLDIS